MANYEQKKSYLDILAVFHYVNGGLAAVVTLAAIAFMGIGLGAASEWGRNFEAEPTCALSAIIFFVLVFAGGYAILNLLAGRALQTRKNRALILVAAAFNCLNMPLGTILGIFTFVMMVDPQVSYLFERGGEAGYVPASEPSTGYAQPAAPAEPYRPAAPAEGYGEGHAEGYETPPRDEA